MITPTKWISGEQAEFISIRRDLTIGNHLRSMVDYFNPVYVFPGTQIAGGVSYFLYDKSYSGEVEFTSKTYVTESDSITNMRLLTTNGIIPRHAVAEKIIKNLENNTRLSSCIHKDLWKLTTSYRGKNVKTNTDDLSVITPSGISYISKSDVTNDLVNEYKVLLSRVVNGSTYLKDGAKKLLSTVKVLKPYEICNNSYMVMGGFGTELEAINAAKYIKTKFARFLLLQALFGIGLTSDRFKFVPLQNFTSVSDIDWSQSISDIDQQLYRKYNLTEKEINFIESIIAPM